MVAKPTSPSQYSHAFPEGAFAMTAREVQADGATPVGQEERYVLRWSISAEVRDMGGRMMVRGPVATRRQAESQVVGRHTAEPVPELRDAMAELEDQFGFPCTNTTGAPDPSSR